MFVETLPAVVTGIPSIFILHAVVIVLVNGFILVGPFPEIRSDSGASLQAIERFFMLIAAEPDQMTKSHQTSTTDEELTSSA